MSGSSRPARIELSRWYASVAMGAVHNQPPPAPEGVERIGAVTVFHPSQGAEIASFGRPACPGVVVFDGYLF